MKKLFIFILLLQAASSFAADILAASSSLANVQAACDSAVSGDRVLIPDGSSTWGGVLDTHGRQIFIQAQHYTPTFQPTNNVTRKVVITWDTEAYGTWMIVLTTGNTYHCGIGGIEFRPASLDVGSGSGIYGFVHISGTGTKPGLVYDCQFVGSQLGATSSGNAAFLTFDCVGGVCWNCFFDGTQETGTYGPGGEGMYGAGVDVRHQKAYTTASTMGTADTGGTNNVYFEDCQFDWFGQLDIEDEGRCVVRHCIQRGIGWQNHGFTSTWGGRHWEQYDCTLLNDRANRNQHRWFWTRGGTALMTGNFIADDNQGYGAMIAMDTGDNTSPVGSYLIDRQAGCGHNGSAYVSDPMYIWSNTGGACDDWGVQSAWSSYIQLNRDIFISCDGTAAKPGWSRYTYPHPLRSQVDGSGGQQADTTVKQIKVHQTKLRK